MIIVVMGVSGAGKTTIGTMLAEQLGWRFYDADDLHSAENKRKMAHGIALTDADRGPWLDAVRELIAYCLSANIDAVIACSALKRSYRDRIIVDPLHVRLVYLKGSEQLIHQRLANRVGHFMSKALLRSQLDTLEEPEGAPVVDISARPQEIVAQIRNQLTI